MDDKVKNTLNITGNDLSWIEENNNAIEQYEKFDANIQIVLRLRRCMKERGWNQKQLAQALNVSPQYINKLLRNQDPTFSVKVASEYGRRLNYPLIKVCDDLESALDYLWDNSLEYDHLFKPSEVWSIDTSIIKGFTFLYKGIQRSNTDKKVRSKKLDLLYA